MLIGTSEQVKKADRIAIEKYNINGITLMYNAAKAVFRSIEDQCRNRSVCILCGKGNNAGDGFALAELLLDVSERVTVCLLCGRSFSDDATYYFNKLSEDIIIVENTIVSSDVYIDAVFGTGFSGKLPQDVTDVFCCINRLEGLKIAIDIPSGLSADDGFADENSFHANITITFQIIKFAHILPGCCELCGKIVVENIGLPIQAITDSSINLHLLSDFILPSKSKISHKGSNGSLISFVGCKEYQGAATLSLLSSLRSGCGLVRAFVPKSIHSIVASKINSAIIYPCDENQSGTLDFSNIGTFDDIIRKNHPDAILAGSGLNVSRDIKKIIKFVLKQDIPCIIDGDGLRYLDLTLLGDRLSPIILTPHLGEFARMINTNMETVQSNRFALAREYAVKNNVILVLKDYMTLISLPDGKQWLFCQPNAGLAKGGSGDVLAGLIASFLAQHFTAEDAAKAGVWYHAQAGKHVASEIGEYAMLPEDLTKAFSVVLK